MTPKMEERRNKAFNRTRQKHVGKTYHMLTVIDIIRYDKKGQAKCWVVCECGKEKECDLWRLINNKIISCGCKKIELASNKLKTHGLSLHPLYHIWESMKGRCYAVGHSGYKKYGAVGIKVCEEWKNDFSVFYEWCINNNWKRRMTIDRFPNQKGNYCPDNCRVATSKQNNNNTSANVILIISGEKITLSNAAEKFGLPYDTLRSRIRMKWDHLKAVTFPVHTRKKSQQPLLL